MSLYSPIRIDHVTKPPGGTVVRQDGHWSTRGLKLCHAYTMPRPGSGSVLSEDMLTKKYNGTITGATYKGNALAFVDNTTHRVTTSCPHPAQNFTIVVSFRYPTQPTNYTIIYSPDDSTLGAMCPELYLSTHQLAFVRLSKDTASTGAVKSPHYVDDGKPHCAAVSVSGSKHVMYCDGKRSANDSGNSSDFVTSNIMYGCKRGSSGSYVSSMGGVINSVYVYNRVLSEGEMYQLSINPWIVFEPAVTWKSSLQSVSWESSGGMVAGGSSRIVVPPVIRSSGGMVAGGISPVSMLYNGNNQLVGTENNYSFSSTETTNKFVLTEV